MSLRRKTLSIATVFSLAFLAVTANISTAAPHQNIDVDYLQTCLKTEGSSLDVLVLMDSSKSLRNSNSTDKTPNGPWKGSDPNHLRGPILKSSLKLLRGLADESDRTINISLRNFGANGTPAELKKLQDKWTPWSSNVSDGAIQDFVDRALYEESPGTSYQGGLSSARNQFETQFNKAELAGGKSCPIMFWITDGAPSDSINPICTSGNQASVDWFREHHVLILGGLLQPSDIGERDKAEKFVSIVEGNSCGTFDEGWTHGTVIKADNISALAWGFIGLIANIKNLVNLNAAGSSFQTDPSTAQINIYINGTGRSWEVHSPDGKVFCSNVNPTSRCLVASDPDIDITTITVFPTDPRKAGGKWSVTPSVEDGEFLVYGSLNTITVPTPDTRIRLDLKSISSEPEEGKPYTIHASLQYSDGTPFDIKGFKDLQICASVASNNLQVCKSSGPSVDIDVNPTSTDKSVEVSAVVTSAVDPTRKYRVSGSLPITVLKSKEFPSLVCPKGEESCILADVPNKQKSGTTVLSVIEAESGASGGHIYLVDFKILADSVSNRGDGNFTFNLSRKDGSSIAWNDPNAILNPGDDVKLTVSTGIDGQSKVEGILKYAVVTTDGKQIIRQLKFEFNVQNSFNPLIYLFLLLAYLITAGIPYAYFLWEARKDAVLNIPDGAFAFTVLPVEITTEGQLRPVGDFTESTKFAPDYKKLEKREVEEGSKSVQIDSAFIEVIPPKWNPFVAPTTNLKIPGSFITSTYGQGNLSFETVPFTPSVVDEAVLYFAADGNINAVRTVTEEVTVDDSGLDFLDVEVETKTNDVTAAPTGAVSGNLLYIVPAYGSRKKSIADIQAKILASLASHEFTEEIKTLREKSLADAVALREQEAALELQRSLDEQKKGSKKKADKTEPKKETPKKDDFEDDEWSTSSGTSNNQNSTSKSEGDDEW